MSQGYTQSACSDPVENCRKARDMVEKRGDKIRASAGIPATWRSQGLTARGRAVTLHGLFDQPECTAPQTDVSAFCLEG